MKKLSLLIAALLLAAGSAFAVEVATTASISGSASVTFGIDLNDPSSHGFANATTTDFTLVLFAEEVVSAGEDPVSGQIALKVAKVEIDETDAPTTFTVPAVTVDSASIKFSDSLSLNILGLGKTIDKASTGQGLNPGVTLVGAGVTNVAENVNEEHKGIGFAIALDGIASFDIGVSSRYDWVTADQNTEGEYSFYLNTALKAVEGLTFEVALNYETAAETRRDNEALGLGFKAGYDLGIVNILAGLDMAGEELQVGAGVALKLGDGSKQNPFGTNDDHKYSEGVTLGFGLEGSDMDLTVAFFDGAVIPVLDLVLLLEIGNLAGDTGDEMDMAIGADLSLDLDGLKPFANFIMVNKDEADTDDYLQIKAGITVDKVTGSVTFKSTTPEPTPDELTIEVKAEKIIPLTDFILTYKSTDLGSEAADDAGVITFETKVSM